MHGASWRLRDQPALQGVRGIAVLGVFAFHLGRLKGGWLGVELFFVLSGFLITALLLTQVERGTASLSGFYWRRVGRLAPALTVTVLGCTAFAFATGTFPVETATGAVMSLAYVANWGNAVLGFDYAAINHVWSLTIEEQYYFVWPLVMLLAGRRWGATGVAWAATTGFVASAAARLLLVADGGDWWHRVYYATDTRAAGLMAGAAAGALLVRSRGRIGARLPGWVLAAGTVGVAGAMLLMSSRDPSVWRYGVTIFDLGVAALLLGLVDRTTTVSAVLSVRPIVWVGDLSYSLYLWHAPVIFFASELVVPTLPRMALQLVLPFILAVVSYRWVEKPVRDRVRASLDRRVRA